MRALISNPPNDCMLTIQNSHPSIRDTKTPEKHSQPQCHNLTLCGKSLANQLCCDQSSQLATPNPDNLACLNDNANFMLFVKSSCCSSSDGVAVEGQLGNPVRSHPPRCEQSASSACSAAGHLRMACKGPSAM